MDLGNIFVDSPGDVNDMNLASVSQPRLRRRTLHEELTGAIRELIVNGELAPGTKIPEKELCTLFDVSRTPLREALKVLATDGLLTLEPNRGARVTLVTAEDLDEVFPVMGALEALAGEMACRNITDSEIAEIRVLHDQMVTRYHDRDLANYFILNEKIHEAILAAARNETLSLQYKSLAARVRRARYIAKMTPDRWMQATDEHEIIMNCLEKRDGQGLSAILKAHLENKLETVRQWLDAQDNR